MITPKHSVAKKMCPISTWTNWNGNNEREIFYYLLKSLLQSNYTFAVTAVWNRRNKTQKSWMKFAKY